MAAMLARESLTTWLVKHVVSPMDRLSFRLTGGRLRLTIGRPVLLLSTVGHRTGQVRQTPVFYLRDGEELVVCNVRPPGERTNPWPQNLDHQPALAAGNATVIKPASPTPWSILKLAEIIGDILPPGVMNIVTGPGGEIGKALATSPRIAKVAFTGETTTGKLIMQYAAQNIIPVTLELGGKSPNIFFSDVMASDDEFLDKAVEGLVLYAFNKGEVCTCPSRALVQADIYEEFMARCLTRIAAIRQGDPLDTDTMLGPQVSAQQVAKISSYVDIGRTEGAEVLIGGARPTMAGDLSGGYFFEPTVLKGHNKMRVFQEEIFGPVLAVTTFTDEADALAIANDSLYGLGAGVWTRDGNRAYRMGRAIKAGRVWTNCYHQYPAGAAFGGYKVSGIGRENHKMMLEHYSQTKNLLVSCSTKPLGLF
jgi:aldehyde dehydrogenase